MEKIDVDNDLILMIDKNFGIVADDKQYILKERKTNNNETSKHFGKVVYNTLGYYGTLKSLFKDLIEILNRRGIMKGKVDSIQELLDRHEKIVEKIEKIIKRTEVELNEKT